MLKNLSRALAVTSLSLLTTTLIFAGEETPKSEKNKRTGRAQSAVEINVVPIGPSQEEIDAVKASVERSDIVQKELNGANYRLLSFQYLEQSDKNTIGKFEPRGFRIVFYDYTNERTVVAEGTFAAPGVLRVAEDAEKPLPSEEELEIAQNLIRRDRRFALLVKKQNARTAPAMPPITVDPATGERLINISLEATGDGRTNEIVGVSLKRNEVVRYAGNAPPTAAAAAGSCGISSAGQGSTGNGTAGQYQTTISQDGKSLWEFLVIRPSASSGRTSERSGIELRDLRYRGKLVMKRAHAPVLNVQYDRNACGPYRDWQYAEGSFQAPDAGATNPAAGIRILAEGQIATTALDTGNDTGNFRGVAIYRQNNETVMVSEMNAGWYRYIMEWRLADDGTILPRYGYGATNSTCVCDVHNHHTYWRFDFDLNGATNNVYKVGGGRSPKRSLITTETKFARVLPTENRTPISLLIENGETGEAYTLTPGANDFLKDFGDDPYGDTDFYVLRYKASGGLCENSEISDCNNRGTAINLDPYINGESVANTDLVVWYGAHFRHADGLNLIDPDRSNRRLILSGTHVVGPEIRPVRW